MAECQKRQVRVLRTLPNEGGRITPKSLVVMDIIVQLEDGSITTVEVQRYGYAFPGQRAACYSADMLLRQYMRKREKQTGRTMNYRKIKPVYTVVLYEKSPGEFHRFPDVYIHHFKQKSDTGLEMELLEEYTFIALDNFRAILQNKGIRNELDAWLTFLSVDDPVWIEKLTQQYPDFKAMYVEVYEMCRNLEDVMRMYSKELLELDEGTVQYMIDEMQEQIREKDEAIKEKDDMIRGQADAIREKDEAIREQADRLKKLERQIQELTAKVAHLKESDS